jgi:hypothetical protein
VAAKRTIARERWQRVRMISINNPDSVECILISGWDGDMRRGCIQPNRQWGSNGCRAGFLIKLIMECVDRLID